MARIIDPALRPYAKQRWLGALARNTNDAALSIAAVGELPTGVIAVNGWGAMSIAFLLDADGVTGTYFVEGFKRLGDSNHYLPEAIAVGATTTAITAGNVPISAEGAAGLGNDPAGAEMNAAGMFFADTIGAVASFPLASVRSLGVNSLAQLLVRVTEFDFVRIRTNRATAAAMAALYQFSDLGT